MKHYFEKAKEYVQDHKKEFTVGGSVVLAVAFIIFGLALYSYNTASPKVVYEPATACQLLTLDEAKELLGPQTINGVSTPPVQTGAVATSKCSYSDGKVDTANAVVAAINVRSGINDAGIALNKTQFANGKPTDNVETVNNVGDSAYFNKTLGQLNILKESTWIIISYGAAASPAANTLDDAVTLAKKILYR
ncbi:MAG TPA: hypothetical protein VIM37_04175 [Candidatus Microsaccharimonas sp.]|jgi:hypothetical protein